MKLSLEWLNDYVDVSDVSVEELKSKLFSSGFEVEEVIETGKDISGVVVGEVLECEAIPETHLHLCRVDCGTHGVFQICCGADNVKVGIKAPVALVGATVLGTAKDHKTIEGIVTINEGKLRGYDSFGMLCSGLEIGVTEEMYQGAEYDGLLILDNSLENGADIKPIVGLDGVVFDIGVTANRPDCQCVLGMAREVAAILNKPLKMPNLSYKTIVEKVEDKISVEVKDSELCPRYTAAYVKNVKLAPSPKWLQKRLASVGIRAINNIVDITNFVLTEIGQPMHSFDYSLLEDKKIIVRRAENGEKLTTLDDKEFTLTDSNLLICDGVKPVALAGIMGGKSSCINDDTKEILFESAKFKRDNIRRSSRSLGKRSDSSSRYEKGIDAYTAEIGLKRALALIDELGVGEIATGFIDVNSEDMSVKSISTTTSKVNGVLGVKVPDDVIIDILKRLNFGVTVSGENITVELPPYREDVEDYPDLAEEIIRMYGYDNIQGKLLDEASVTSGGLNKSQKDVNNLKNYFVSQGFLEAVTYSFISEKDYELLGLDVNSGEYKFIKIMNPLGEDLSVMRTTLLPSLLKVLTNNINKKNASARIFEFAKTFNPKSLPLTELPVENETISLGIYGENENFFTLKGVIENMFKAIRSTFKVEYKACGKMFMHPTRSAEIYFGNNCIGYFGELHPSISDKLGIDKKLFVGEIKYSKISAMLNRKLVYEAIPKYPSVERDLALVMDKSKTNAEVVRNIKKFGGKALKSVELFDVYEGDKISASKKSLAYHLVFNDLSRSLTLEEVEGYVSDILYNLQKLGIELR